MVGGWWLVGLLVVSGWWLVVGGWLVCWMALVVSAARHCVVLVVGANVLIGEGPNVSGRQRRHNTGRGAKTFVFELLRLLGWKDGWK